MKNRWLLLGCMAVWMTAGAAHAAPIPMSEARAREIAKMTVYNAVKDSLPAGQRIANIRVSLRPFAGDVKNPITGAAIHRVYVDQVLTDGADASLNKRMAHRFSKFRERSFDVKVHEDGRACIFGEQNYSPRARLGRFVDRNLPVRPLLAELVHSGKATELGLAVVAGGTAYALEPMTALGAIPFVVNAVVKAKKDTRQTHEQAIETTLAWAKSWRTERGQFPTLAQTYARYKEELAPTGIRGVSGFDFAQKIALKGL